MDEKYPDQGAGDDGQNIYAERAVVSPPPTGDERVDGAVAGLSRLPGLAVEEHVAVLEEVHGRLRDILGELNEGPGGPGPRVSEGPWVSGGPRVQAGRDTAGEGRP